MYCPKCGTPLEDGVTVCPYCEQPEVVPYVEEKPKRKFFNAPSKGAKCYAAIFSAGLVFPAMLCTVIDFLTHTNHGIETCWFDSVIAALIVIWMIFVYPTLGITRYTVSATLSIASVMSFILYISYKAGYQTVITRAALPLVLIFLALLALDIALIGGKRIKGFHAVSLIALETGAYLVAAEVLIDKIMWGSVQLQWSIIIACAFVSIIAFAEAFSYVGRVCKKK